MVTCLTLFALAANNTYYFRTINTVHEITGLSAGLVNCLQDKWLNMTLSEILDWAKSKIRDNINIKKSYNYSLETLTRPLDISYHVSLQETGYVPEEVINKGPNKLRIKYRTVYWHRKDKEGGGIGQINNSCDLCTDNFFKVLKMSDITDIFRICEIYTHTVEGFRRIINYYLNPKCVCERYCNLCKLKPIFSIKLAKNHDKRPEY